MNEEQAELAPKDYANDRWPSERISYRGNWYENREEARWAYVFDQLCVPFDYRPKHFGLTIDVGLRPSFFLQRPEMWFHCCSTFPSPSTVFALQVIAQRTGIESVVAPSACRPPSRTAGPMRMVYIASADHLAERILLLKNGALRVRDARNTEQDMQTVKALHNATLAFTQPANPQSSAPHQTAVAADTNDA